MTRAIYMWGSLMVLASMMGCAGSASPDAELMQGRDPAAGRARIAACPASPNCVTSVAAAADEEHSIAPLRIEGEAERAWDELVALLEATPRTKIVKNEQGYLHAEFTTRLMRYVDDVEFVMSADRNEIDVRSASRVGYGDMGVNRERIEWIRGELADRHVIRGARASGP